MLRRDMMRVYCAAFIAFLRSCILCPNPPHRRTSTFRLMGFGHRVYKARYLLITLLHEHLC